MEFLGVGSKWRDYLLDGEGGYQSPAETVQRLAHDTRPEIAHVLDWLLRRLYDVLQNPDEDRVRVLDEATRHLEGQSSNDGAAVASTPSADLWAEPPGMQSIWYLQQGIEASRSVVTVRLTNEAHAHSGGSTGWLLTPYLVVVPAHILDGRFDTSFDDDPREGARIATVHFDFDTPDARATAVAVESMLWVDPHLDIAVLRLEEAVPIADPLLSDRTRPIRKCPDWR